MIRPLAASDAASLLAVHRAAFAPAEIDDTILGAARIEAWLARAMAEPEAGRERLWIGFEKNRLLVGYAEFCNYEKSFHLNQISVIPEYQDEQIGKQLLIHGIKIALRLNAKAISLDVREDNHRANGFYSRRGFALVATSDVHHGWPTGMTSRGEATALCLDWPFAELAQEAFGFSRLTLRHSGRESGQITPVLRLAEGRFRMAGAIAAPVLRFLQTRFADLQKTLVLVGQSGEALPGMRRAYTVLRRNLDLETLTAGNPMARDLGQT